MSEPTCATCPWWSRFPERVEFRLVPGQGGEQEEIRTPNEKGECRKLPPLFTRTFPISGIDDWCGEHPERKQADRQSRGAGGAEGRTPPDPQDRG